MVRKGGSDCRAGASSAGGAVEQMVKRVGVQVDWAEGKEGEMTRRTRAGVSSQKAKIFNGRTCRTEGKTRLTYIKITRGYRGPSQRPQFVLELIAAIEGREGRGWRRRRLCRRPGGGRVSSRCGRPFRFSCHEGTLRLAVRNPRSLD